MSGRAPALTSERPARSAARWLARPVRLFLAAHAVAVLGAGTAALLIGHGLEMPPVPSKPQRVTAPPVDPSSVVPHAAPAAPDWTQRPDVAAPWSRP